MITVTVFVEYGGQTASRIATLTDRDVKEQPTREQLRSLIGAKANVAAQYAVDHIQTETAKMEVEP